MHRRTFLTGGMSVVASAALTIRRAQAADGANVVGRWQQLSYTSPLNPIHVALLRPDSSGDTRVLIAPGSESDQVQARKVAAVMNVTRGTFALRNMAEDVFCNGMSFLPDGRVFITGGTNAYEPLGGAPYAIIFDPATEQFTRAQDMHQGRFYPTNVTLRDGRIMTISGLDENRQRSRTLEIYNSANNTWTAYALSFSVGAYLYPHLHLLPTGLVSYIEKSSSSAPAYMRDYNPVTNVWRSFSSVPLSFQANGCTVLLPLRPPYITTDCRILTAGGNTIAPNSAVATAELIRPVGTISRTALPSMRFARNDPNAVLLPTGHVLLSGGATKHRVRNTGVRTAEWFNPSTNQWTALAVANVGREYHSVALLLPDARVLAMGSNPTSSPTDNWWEERIEIYSPPYLYTLNSSGQVVSAARPVITSISATSIPYTSSFTIATPSSASISSVMLMRPGAVTHALDMEQRAVYLSFSRPSSSQLSITAPPHDAVAPVGYYMLFLINNKGVPSLAKWVKIIR